MSRPIRCPKCGQDIDYGDVAAQLGARKSPRKAKSSAENGRKGGRPPNPKPPRS